MKKYDALDIAIKILGLSLIPNALYWIGQAIVWVPSISPPVTQQGFQFDTLLAYLTSIVFYILPVYLFVFKSKFILHKIFNMQADAVDEDILVNRQAILEIAMLIIAGITLMRTIPDFCMHIVQAVQIKKLHIDMPEGNFPNSWIYREGSELFLAVIFIVYAKPVAKYFATRTNKEEKVILPKE